MRKWAMKTKTTGPLVGAKENCMVWTRHTQEIPSYLILRRWFLPFGVTLGHHFQSAALVFGCFSYPLYFSATISFSVRLLSFALLPCLSSASLVINAIT